MLGPLHQNEHFFKGPTPPLSKLKFPPYRQNRSFSTEETFFFVIALRDLHFFWVSGEYF